MQSQMSKLEWIIVMKAVYVTSHSHQINISYSPLSLNLNK